MSPTLLVFKENYIFHTFFEMLTGNFTMVEVVRNTKQIQHKTFAFFFTFLNYVLTGANCILGKHQE